MIPSCIAYARVSWMLQSRDVVGIGLLPLGRCFSMAALDHPILHLASLNDPILGCFSLSALDAPIHGSRRRWSPFPRPLLCQGSPGLALVVRLGKSTLDATNRTVPFLVCIARHSRIPGKYMGQKWQFGTLHTWNIVQLVTLV